jgi:hypothetical protein
MMAKGKKRFMAAPTQAPAAHQAVIERYGAQSARHRRQLAIFGNCGCLIEDDTGD